MHFPGFGSVYNVILFKPDSNTTVWYFNLKKQEIIIRADNKLIKKIKKQQFLPAEQ